MVSKFCVVNVTLVWMFLLIACGFSGNSAAVLPVPVQGGGKVRAGVLVSDDLLDDESLVTVMLFFGAQDPLLLADQKSNFES